MITSPIELERYLIQLAFPFSFGIFIISQIGADILLVIAPIIFNFFIWEKLKVNFLDHIAFLLIAFVSLFIFIHQQNFISTSNAGCLNLISELEIFQACFYSIIFYPGLLWLIYFHFSKNFLKKI